MDDFFLTGRLPKLSDRYPEMAKKYPEAAKILDAEQEDQGESTIEERMTSGSPDGIDPFETLGEVKDALRISAESLAKSKPGLGLDRLALELLELVKRSD